MNNNEKLFRLLGWKHLPNIGLKRMKWIPPKGSIRHLPDVSNDYELCRQYVIPEMRKWGYEFRISLEFYCQDDDSYEPERWLLYHQHNGEFLDKGVYSEIKNDNIAGALVESAIRVLEKETKC